MPSGCQAPVADRGEGVGREQGRRGRREGQRQRVQRERDLRGVIGSETPLYDTVIANG